MGRNKHTKKEVPTKTKLKKDPGIPKLPDLKQKKNAERQKATQRSAQPFKRDPDSPMASEPTLSSLAALAEASDAAGRTYDASVADPSSSSSDAYKVQLRRQYIRALHKVIEESDIVILVLDARDPEGCRSRLVEEEVRRREHEGKRLVFVLNKIDLVPRENAEAWLRYLRHTTPTLPFRASTQQQRSNLLSKTSPALLNLLKGYKRSAKAGSVTVGVVGYPNVGKSSLINSLRRAKVCAVAAEAGFTKEIQSVQIERGVRVLDSPGVVFDDDEQENSNLLLRNAVKVEDMKDPIAVVDQILSKTEPSKLQEIYKLPHFSSTLELLTMLALSSGRLHKGGTPDVLAAARQVIQDWNSQKTPYWTTPPVVHPSSVPSTVSAGAAARYGLSVGEGGVVPGAEDVGNVQIVSAMAPAFDLGGLFSQADAGAFDCEMQDGEAEMSEGGIVEMESDDLAPQIPRKRSRAPSPSPSISTRADAGSDLPRMLSLPGPPDTPPSKRLKRSEPQGPPSNIGSGNAAATSLSVAPGIAAQNPLGRRALKKDAKRARKAARKAGRSTGGGGRGGGMEVDDESGENGLAFTFMAGVDGVISP